MRVRDAVCGDIIFDELQEYCIRSQTFQRLHRIKQLGNTFQVYPSAMHTRFEHSLGVCYQVKRLLSQPRFFPRKYKPDADKRKLIELAGLLHDLVHTPFKHTLDRDVALLPKGKLVDEYRFRFDQMHLSNRLAPDQMKFLMSIFSTENPFDMELPYLRQIIEDTISADLLDYTLRDSFFTAGPGRQWDDRIYDHIAVCLYAGKPCLVARITDETGKVTQSAITELVNLLQIRYMLNERIYFYPTKIAADSLLVKSVRVLLEKGEIEPQVFKEKITDMSDEEVINYLLSIRVPKNCSYYAECLKNRIFPAMAFRFLPHELTQPEKESISSSLRGPDCLDRWTQCEKNIAKEAGIKPRDIIIYCHDLEMQKKEPDFLVQDNLRSTPRTIAEYHVMKDDIEAIGKKHKNLWRCYVYSLDRSEKSIRKIRSVSPAILRSLKSDN